jgi:hypothetical protein
MIGVERHSVIRSGFYALVEQGFGRLNAELVAHRVKTLQRR